MNSIEIQHFNRPVKLGIIFSVTAELIIFVFYGLILFPEGNLLYKFLWTIAFCGIGMGATVGALIQLFVIGRFTGSKAILACSIISVGVLGIACNILCLNLDSHYHYFGGADNPILFIAGGVILSAIGGGLAGWLIFSAKGDTILRNLKV
jgi:hypothetical protein